MSIVKCIDCGDIHGIWDECVRSNTAMTMPDKLTAWEFMPGEQNEWLRGGWDVTEERSYEMKYRNYVAADIAEELARALEDAMDTEAARDLSLANAALTRYKDALK